MFRVIIVPGSGVRSADVSLRSFGGVAKHELPVSCSVKDKKNLLQRLRVVRLLQHICPQLEMMNPNQLIRFPWQRGTRVRVTTATFNFLFSLLWFISLHPSSIYQVGLDSPLHLQPGFRTHHSVAVRGAVAVPGAPWRTQPELHPPASASAHETS